MTKPVEVKTPLVCSVGGCTFIVRYYDGYELHIFACKDDKTLNWTEKYVYPAERMRWA